MPSIKDFDKDKKKKKHDKKIHHSNPKTTHSEDFKIESDGKEVSMTSSSSLKTEKRRPSHTQTQTTPGQEQADLAEGMGEKLADDKQSSAADSDFHSNTRSAANENDGAHPESFQSFSEGPRFELNFPGSFLIKAKAPKAFDLAERIAGDWINDGKFESLPVGHPLAQLLAAKTLTKAKSIEKDVLSSTPLALAKIGIEYAKSKIKR